MSDPAIGRNFKAKNAKTGLWFVAGKHFAETSESNATVMSAAQLAFVRASYDNVLDVRQPVGVELTKGAFA